MLPSGAGAVSVSGNGRMGCCSRLPPAVAHSTRIGAAAAKATTTRTACYGNIQLLDSRRRIPVGLAAAGGSAVLRNVKQQQHTSSSRSISCSAAAVSVAQPSPLPGSAPAPAPARPFLTVVLPTAMTLMLCNMDRICLSVAILPMSKEMGWPTSLQGVIQSAFLYGYMATQLLGGTLADKYGGKVVMAAGILWFSAASLLLPIAVSEPVRNLGWTIPAVLAARCMVGLGEGVALPTMNNLIANHIPKQSKARALGMAFSGFHSGNLLGLVLSPILLLQLGWRWLFCIFGLLGAPLLAMWLTMVPDTAPCKATDDLRAAAAGGASTAAGAAAAPAASAGRCGGASFQGGPGWAEFAGASRVGVQAAGSRAASSSGTASFGAAGAGSGAVAFRSRTPPAAAATSHSLPGLQQRVPAPEIGVRELLSHPATWAIIVVNIVNHWGYFIYLNWMPTYFSAALGFDLRASSFLSFLPWLVMAGGSSAAGVLADTMVSRGMPVTQVRKSLQTVAFLIPALALLLLAQPGIKPGVAVAAMTVALGTTSLGQAGFVANMSDIAPNHAGQMFGLCNTFGSLSGIIGVTAVGFIVEATQSFSPVFLLTASMYVLGTIIWNFMCVGERVF